MRTITALTCVIFAACGEKEPDDSTPADDSAVEGDADTDADTDTDTDTDAVPLDASLQGTITTLGGAPMSNVRVQMCRELCRTAMTDASGAYEFPALEGFTHSFEVVILEDGWPTPMVPLTLVAETPHTLDALVPEYTDEVAMPASPAEVTVGALTLTVGLDELSLPFGADDSAVRAVQVPEAAWLPVEGAAEVVAMWYIGPFDAHADSPMPFQLTNELGLSPGDTVQAWAADYVAAEWVSAGEMTVSEDGALLVNDGTGLPILSTLALVRE